MLWRLQGDRWKLCGVVYVSNESAVRTGGTVQAERRMQAERRKYHNNSSANEGNSTLTGKIMRRSSISNKIMKTLYRINAANPPHKNHERIVHHANKYEDAPYANRILRRSHASAIENHERILDYEQSRYRFARSPKKNDSIYTMLAEDSLTTFEIRTTSQRKHFDIHEPFREIIGD